jgi:ribosome-binding factor A
MKGFIRKILGTKMRIKILPSLTFYPDTSIKYSVEISKKIDEVLGDDENS